MQSARLYLIYGGESHHFNAPLAFEVCQSASAPNLSLRSMLAGQSFVHQSLPFFPSHLSKVALLQFCQ